MDGRYCVAPEELNVEVRVTSGECLVYELRPGWGKESGIEIWGLARDAVRIQGWRRGEPSQGPTASRPALRKAA